VLIKQVKSADTLTLRQQILLPNSDINACIFEGDDDKSTVHFAAIKAGAIVGILSIFQRSNSSISNKKGFQLRAMAVVAEERGKGLGLQLLSAAEKHAANNNADYIWANAKSDAAGFYRKANYQIDSEVFEIAPVGPHQKVIKHSNKSAG